MLVARKLDSDGEGAAVWWGYKAPSEMGWLKPCVAEDMEQGRSTGSPTSVSLLQDHTVVSVPGSENPGHMQYFDLMVASVELQGAEAGRVPGPLASGQIPAVSRIHAMMDTRAPSNWPSCPANCLLRGIWQPAGASRSPLPLKMTKICWHIFSCRDSPPTPAVNGGGGERERLFAASPGLLVFWPGQLTPVLCWFVLVLFYFM